MGKTVKQDVHSHFLLVGLRCHWMLLLGAASGLYQSVTQSTTMRGSTAFQHFWFWGWLHIEATPNTRGSLLQGFTRGVNFRLTLVVTEQSFNC